MISFFKIFSPFCFRRLSILIGFALILFSQIGFAMETRTEPVQLLLEQRFQFQTYQSVVSVNEVIFSRKKLPEFYAAGSFAPAWLNDQMIADLVERIEKADEDGLHPADYHLEAIHSILKLKNTSPLSASLRADLDLLLTDAFLIFAAHLLNGKINPETVNAQWLIPQEESSPLVALNKAASTGNVKETLLELYPRHPGYGHLKTALKKYREFAEAGGWLAISEGETLKPGMTGPRIKQLRYRMMATGDLAKTDTLQPDLYDSVLLAGVLRFQKRHGLDADGAVGRSSIRAMNISVEDRIAQIKANLERWRWLPRDFGNFYILVNIPEFGLTVVRDETEILSMDVIVGRSYRQTPVFAGRMTYLELNPTWTVPPTILREDVIPAVRKDPDYLRKKNMKVLSFDGKEVDPATIDWSNTRSFPYMIRQAAGRTNALGTVKFMFPNKYNVYLHDTNDPSLFRKADRSASSGCIRISKPHELAGLLLEKNPKWPLSRIQEVIKGGKTTIVTLPEFPYVFLIYWTAKADENGQVFYFQDIYSRDKPLMEALETRPNL